MSYVDGYLMAVPTANKEKFITHASRMDDVFIEFGAMRVVECWGDDVPEGEVTDFRRAVNAGPDESVVLAWVEWPDRSTRDAANEKIEALWRTDPRFDSVKNPMPFDGKRLVLGGFSPVLDISR